MATMYQLQHLPILKELTTEQLLAFGTRLQEHAAEAGELIIREGELGNRLYLLAEGTVEISERMTLKISRRSFEDRDRTLVRLSSEMGVFFGEMALFEDVARTANVVAVTACRLLTMDRAGFEAFAQAEPYAGYLILREVARGMSMRLQRSVADIKKLTTALSIAVH